MKRNFKLLVAVVVLVATVFTLASCAAIQGFIDKLKPQPPVHEHTFSEEWSYDETNHWHAATCTDTEECATATSNVTAHSYYANGHCSVCGAVDPEFVPECTEHSFSVEETKAPTCTEEGEKTFTCDDCGYSYTQAVAALGHTEEKVAGKAPTCTEAGLSDGKVCTVCGETTKAQTTINATGHNYVEGTCSVCGAEDPDYNGVRTYVLDVQTLTAFAQGDKADGAVEEYSSFYTIYYSAKTKVDTTKNKTWPDGYTVAEGLRLNWGGTTAINDDVKDEEGNVTGYVTKNAIKIVVNGTATVKVWWNCGGDGREIGIFDEDGELVVASQTDDVFTEGTEGVGAGKNNNYLSELTISKPGTYYIGTDNTNAIKNGGNIIFKVETKVTPIEEEPANEIEATTTDNNCWVDKVTFTAGGEGKYTFTLPAGLGAWEATDCDTFPPVNGPYVDYYNNLEGATFTVGLEAGATLEFYIGSTSKQDWVIEWSYEACDVEDSGSTGGDDVIDNEELAMGENSVVIGEEHATDGKDYTFVVTEAGTYTFASDSLLAIVLDSTGMQIGRYEVALEAGTYTVKLISMAGAGTYSVNVTVATAGGDDDDDTPTEPDGSENNPYVWDTLPESATADGDSNNMIYYTFTATENGVLNITYATANSWLFVTDKTDPSLSDSASNKDVNSFNIVAGHVYVIGLGVWTAEDSDPTVTISLGDPIDPDTCEHEWSQVWFHEDVVNATCTTPGVAVFCCDICGTYKTEATEIDPDGHDYVTNTETYVAPTCQTDGYREATCSYCNDHQEYVLSSEEYGFHDMVVDKEEYPTCTTGGCYIAHCQTEGCDYSVNETSEPNGHYNYTVTCGQTGECLECGETFTKEHNLTWSPATCTEAAYCWDCDSSVGEPLGHTPGDAATCDTPQICTVCEEVIAEPKHPAITHVEAKAATCFENGNIEYWYCETCGYAWLDEACTQNTNLLSVVLPMAHAPLTHVEAKAATCFENGNIEYWYCEACGYAWLDAEGVQSTNLKAVVTPMAHAPLTHVEAKAATCFENGNIEHWYCEVCGYAWLDAEGVQSTNLKAVVLPMAHAPLTHVEAKAATCFENGNIEHWYCEVCGYAWLDAEGIQSTNLKAVVLPMGHAPLTHVEAKAATCFENGNIEHWYCEACGYAWLDAEGVQSTNLKAVVLPMAHAPLTHVEAKAATCFENGNIEHWYCEVCGYAWLDAEGVQSTNLKAVVLPMAHAPLTHVEAKDATCTENGNIEYWYCEPCGYAWLDAEGIQSTNLKAVVLPTLAHTDSNYDSKCEVCEKYFLPAAGEAFKLQLVQANLGKTLYFTGEMNGYYYATGDYSEAIDLYIENATDGFNIYFLDGETKNYLYVIASGTHINVKIGTSNEGNVWTFNEELGTLVTDVNGTAYYIGTYGTYNTISASKTSFISASNVNVSQFAARAVVIPEHDHVYEGGVVTAPTCTAAGYTTYTCTVCGGVTVEDGEEALGHSYSGVETAPTCTAAGYTTYTCANCSDTYKEDGEAALGHSYTEGICSVCGAVEGAVEPTVVTLTKTGTEINSIATVTDGSSAALDENITVSFSKGAVSTSPKLHSNGYLLIYQNNSGKENGNVITITAAEGCTLSSVKFVIYSGGQNGADGANLQVTGGTVAADADGNLVFTANSGATSISVTPTGTNNKTDRIWIESITVEYTK